MSQHSGGCGSMRGAIHYSTDERLWAIRGRMAADVEKHFPDNLPTPHASAEIPHLTETEEERAA